MNLGAAVTAMEERYQVEIARLHQAHAAEIARLNQAHETMSAALRDEVARTRAEMDRVRDENVRVRENNAALRGKNLTLREYNTELLNRVERHVRARTTSDAFVTGILTSGKKAAEIAKSADEPIRSAEPEQQPAIEHAPLPLEQRIRLAAAERPEHSNGAAA